MLAKLVTTMPTMQGHKQ